MADETNRLVNEIDVQEAQGARSRANSFSKYLRKLFDKPEGYEAKITAKMDQVSYNGVTRSFRDITKRWESMRKTTHAGIFGGMFKDKRQITDVNKLFGKLEIKAVEAMSKYQEQLEQLQGQDGNEGEKLDVQKQVEKYAAIMENLKTRRSYWEEQKQQWEEYKESLKDQPDLITIQGQKTKLQAQAEKLAEQWEDAKEKAFSAGGNQGVIQTKIEDASNTFLIAIKQAAALKEKYNDEELWKKFTGKVNSMSRDTNKKSKELSNQLEALKLQQQDLQKQKEDMIADISKGSKTYTNEMLTDVNKQLDSVGKNIGRVQGLLNKEDIRKRLVAEYKKDIKLAQKDAGREFRGSNWKYENLKNDALGQNKQAGKFESNALTWTEKMTVPDQEVADLKAKLDAAEAKIADLQSKEKSAQNTTEKKAKADKHIASADRVLAAYDKTQDSILKKSDLWKQKLEDISLEIEKINEQMQLIMQDSGVNPFSYNLKADALQSINQDTDELNRKWGVMGTTWEKIKAKMNGVQGYMRKINVFSRLWHKVILNIYSQIATLINPLNIFKRAWNDWINRFDNAAWKNTFEVISYNLTTVIAPLLEKCAVLALRFVAAINVFTKRWAGVDLFDKSAWQLEKIKKGVGQLTASFDELHASNENPDALNTVFDKFIDEDSLISDDAKDKLNGFADWAEEKFAGVKDTLKNVWDWAQEHPIAAAVIGGLGLTALHHLPSILWGGAKLAFKGIGKLGKWIGGKLFGKTAVDGAKTAGTTFGSKVMGFLNKGLYTGMNGSTVTVGKFVAGIGLVAGGVATAAGSAKDAGKNWQDYNAKQKAVRIGGVALGSAMAGIGAVMLGASGPVGWAVAGAVALGAFCIGMAQTQNGIGSVKDETEKWAKTQENLQNAIENTQGKMSNYLSQLSSVKQLEQATGKSGEELANQIGNGTLKVENLTAAEAQLYYAYINSKKALEELTKAQKEEFKAKQEDVNQEAKVLAANGKESGSYDELAQHIKTCWENGTMDTETAKDLMNRAMADMSDYQKKVFTEQMPAALQQGLEPEQYASGFQKFGTWVGDRFKDWVDNWKVQLGLNTNEMEEYQGTIDDLISAEETLQEKMDARNKLQEQTTELEKKAGMTIEELKEKMNNGEIAYNGLTDAQKALLKSSKDLQNAQAEVDKALDTTGEHVAGLAYEEYKQTGDYKKFIETLKQQNEQGNISSSKMNKKFGEIMSDMTSSEQAMFKQYMKDMGLSTSSAEQYCNNSQTIFQRWHSKISGFFQDVGQRIGNLFSGKGFKTDLELNISTNVNGVNANGVAHMDVGTNYVPNDGLAYIHKGEAVIPAKYNKPYSPGGDNSRLESSINALTRQVEQIGQLVNQGIPITGQFVQRGSDLVATVEKASNKLSNNVLNNKVYAR